MSLTSSHSSREVATEFSNGDQINMHASSPDIISFKALQVERKKLAERAKTPERILLEHELVAQFGDYLEDFRLWETEMAQHMHDEGL